MPCHYRIDSERQLIITTARDRVTFAEAKAHQDRLRSDPAFNPDFDQLIDATAVTELDVSNSEASVLAGAVFFSPVAKRALAAASPAVFGVLRLMETRHHLANGGENTCVFYDRAAALEWLGHSSVVEVI